MSSIKAKLLKFLGLLIGAICIGLGIISFISSLESIAEREDIKDPNNSIENKKFILSSELKRKGSKRMSIIDKEGNLTNSDGTTANVKERPYFIKAMSGKSNARIIRNND